MTGWFLDAPHVPAPQEQRNKVSMGYDDDEEYGGGGGGGGNDGNGYDRRQRSASPPKVVDVEKIKPNTEENKGEIRSASCPA